MDGGYLYRVPPQLAGRAAVGSLVRVPLGGRTVRGFVMESGGPPPADPDTLFPAVPLKNLGAVLGGQPVFTSAMLPALRESARHYISPLSAMLGRAAPPNLPRRPSPLALPSLPPATSPVPEASRAAAAGRYHPPVSLLAGRDRAQLIARAVSAPLRAEKSALVIAPTAAEAARLAHRLRRSLGRRVVEAAGERAAAVTEAWSRAAAQPGLAVVGTMRAAWWPVRDLAMMVLVEEGRRGMKERRTPTVAAARHARLRAREEGFSVVATGRVPTLESVVAQEATVRVRGRLWPPVEMADRRREPPGGGVITERARIALRAAAGQGGPALVFCHRRGYSPAARCAACRSLRLCPQCGSRPDPGPRCPRCGAELGGCPDCGGKRFDPLGAGAGRVLEELSRKLAGAPGEVGEVASGREVMVGTERDLPDLPPLRLAVVVDGDGLVRRPDYRAGEEALALLARVAGCLGRESGRRMMVQTADPEHPLYRALRSGDPTGFLEGEAEARRALGLPPAGEMILLEAAGADDLSPLEEALRQVPASVAVHGPVQEGGRSRWLIQGSDLDPFRDRLRPALARVRDKGGRVRADVDPRDI